MSHYPPDRFEPTSVDHSDDDPIYELPYKPGACFQVLQGYGGTYSHFGDSHFSIDFRMPEGTPICASRSGVVYRVINHFTASGTHPSFKPMANVIHILHPDDSLAAYVHLMHCGNCVVSGDAVSTGQIIGYSGNTGWSSTPHLHFHIADAVFHHRVPALFNTVECEKTTLKADRWYTRPSSPNQHLVGEMRPHVAFDSNIERDACAFSPELFQLAIDVAGDLSLAGYERMSGYSSIDPMHDVHGLEVCGIQSADDTLEITRLLLRRFPAWNAGWIHSPNSSAEGWVARIQRDCDALMEYWDTD